MTTEPKAIFEDMVRQAKEINATIMTISGEVEGGWGFRIQVVRPDVWQKIQRRDEDFEEDDE